MVSQLLLPILSSSPFFFSFLLLLSSSTSPHFPLHFFLPSPLSSVCGSEGRLPEDVQRGHERPPLRRVRCGRLRGTHCEDCPERDAEGDGRGRSRSAEIITRQDE